MTEAVLGIDIGGTGIKFGLVDRSGKILIADKTKTKGYPDPEKLPAELHKWAVTECDKSGIQLAGVGIGTPNGNYFTGTIDHAPNLPWKGVIPMKEFFEKHFQLPVALTNDAKAAAIGEMFFGAAKGITHFLFITLGTGLGAGIVVNGNIIYGYDSLAGEVGHVIVYRNGRECGCGRKGCLEQYASATGIVKTYYELLRQKNIEKFRLSLGNMIDSEEIFEKAKAGDEVAIDAFKRTGEILGFALANSVCYTRPQKIFLFGGLSHAGDLLFEPTRTSFENYLMPIYKNKIDILMSGLNDDEAGILGSASLIWKELKSQEPGNRNQDGSD